MPSVLKILFVDDHSGLRDGLGFLLSQNNPSLSFYNATTGEECLQILKNNPDILTAIVDLNLNGKSGIAIIPQLREITPKLNIIIYTMFNDPVHIEESLKADIQGYVTKDAGIKELEHAIITVSEGNTYYNKVTSQIMHSLLQRNSEPSKSRKNDSSISLFERYKSLTKKEQEVFALLAQKKETYEIAEVLKKSEKTVINQKSIIYQKLNIRDRLDLIENAKLLGVIL